MKLFISIIFLFILTFQANCSTIQLWRQNSSNYSIILPSNSNADLKKGASILQKYIQQKSGINFPIIDEQKYKGSSGIYIGQTRYSKSKFNTNSLSDRGYYIGQDGNNILLIGKTERGSLNSIFGFLEKYLDIELLSKNDVYFSKENQKTIDIKNQYFNPSFERMDIFNAISYTDLYGFWYGNDHLFKNNFDSEWGIFGHTFFAIIPPSKYLKSNPDFFLYDKGSPSQLNIYNSKLVEEVKKNLKELMSKKPNKKYWMVGQEDDKTFFGKNKSSNLSNDLMKFINNIASSFPDKIIGTFAYQESLSAPTNIKPLTNVYVCFAPIDAVYNQNIYSGVNIKYSNELIKWSELTKNLMVWEYVSNYSNPMMPYPTFNVISENLKFYHKTGVKRIYLEGINRNEEVFNELYTYLFNKLYWNINQDPNFIVKDFCNKFYGPAGNYIVKYITELQNNVKNTGDRFRFYDTSNKYLDSKYLNNYDAILADASKSVDSSPIFLKRVNKVRSQIDINLMGGNLNKGDNRSKRFKQTMKDTEVSSLMFKGKSIKVQ